MQWELLTSTGAASKNIPWIYPRLRISRDFNDTVGSVELSSVFQKRDGAIYPPWNQQFAPANGPSQKEIHLPTIDFQGKLTVSFREGTWYDVMIFRNLLRVPSKASPSIGFRVLWGFSLSTSEKGSPFVFRVDIFHFRSCYILVPCSLPPKQNESLLECFPKKEKFVVPLHWKCGMCVPSYFSVGGVHAFFVEVAYISEAEVWYEGRIQPWMGWNFVHLPTVGACCLVGFCWFHVVGGWSWRT